MNAARFLVVCLNPTFQRTLVLNRLRINEVNRSSEHYFSVSGKGVNAARVLKQLGCRVLHLTHLGGESRELFRSMAEEEGIALVWVDSASPIRTCTTLLDSEAGTTTEEPQAVRSGTEKRLLSSYAGLLSRTDVVIISGSKAPGYSEETVPRMVRDARALGKLVILDLRGEDLLNSLPFSPDIIKPNFSEFLRTFRPELEQGEHADDAEALLYVKEQMLALYRRWNTLPVITAGSRPTLYIEGGKVASRPVSPITPVNTIGSGDAFTAGLAAVVAGGGGIGEAVARAQECGAANAVRTLPGTII